MTCACALLVSPKITRRERNKECADIANDSGFWDDLDPHKWWQKHGLQLALVNTEIAEAMEEVRRGKPVLSENNFDIYLEELADAVIRIFDIAGHSFNSKFGEILVRKMLKNRERERKHGKLC